MSGYSEIYTGSFVGTGALLTIKRASFTPRKIHILGSDGSEANWSEGMPEGSMHKRVAGGTGTFPQTNGITPIENGFTLGTDAFNADARTYYYTVYS